MRRATAVLLLCILVSACGDDESKCVIDQKGALDCREPKTAQAANVDAGDAGGAGGSQ